MADKISREEFLAQLDEATPITVAPLSQQALDEQSTKLARGRVESVAPSSKAEADWATKLGARPGVPFDTQSGVSFMSRLRAAAQPTPEEEQTALEAAYGKGNVRRNSFGWLVVTKPGTDSKPTDVLVDPVGLDTGDFASVIGQLPEIAGSIVTALATRGTSAAPGILNAAKTLLAAVGGAAAGGATKDVLVRGAEGNPLQPGEIVTRRGEQAVLDAATATAMGVGAKGLGFLITPKIFGKPGEIQFDALKAQKYFQDKTGIKVELTPAEMTGNSFLQRVEAIESQKPGASVPFEKLFKKRQEQLAELQQIALGGAVPEEEAAGQRALAALNVKTAPLTQNIETAANDAAAAAKKELVAGVGPAVDKVAVGDSIRQGAAAARDAFNAANDANYAAVFSNPLAKQPIIEGRGLKQSVDDLLKELPKVEQQVTKPTGLVGPTGSPLTTTVAEDVPISTPVRPRLEELSAKLENGKVSLNDLKQIRTDVDNAIKTGEAIPGVKEGRLKTLYSSLTRAIEQGLQDINDPGLTAAWQKATSYYKANVGKFEKAGIAELFRDPINAMGPHEVVGRAINSPDTYAAYKEFFGAGSPQMQGVRQAIRDETLGLSDLSPTIGASTFVKRLEALPQEVRQDVFGNKAGDLRAAAQALRAAGGESLPTAELEELLKSGNLSAQKISQMVTAQRGKDVAYRNELVKAVSEGNLKPDSIKPTEFVNRLVFKKNTQPDDVKEIMALLHDRPDVTEDIRRLTFQRALDESTVVSPATGKRTILATELEDFLADENTAKRLRLALGASTYEDLVQLKNLLKPGTISQQAAKTAGGLSAGMQVAGMMERGPLKYVVQSVRNYFVSVMYTHPKLRAYLTNTALSSTGKANLVNLAIASEPFLTRLLKDVPDAGERKAIVLALKQGVDASVQEDPTQADVPPSREEFLQQLGP